MAVEFGKYFTPPLEPEEEPEPQREENRGEGWSGVLGFFTRPLLRLGFLIHLIVIIVGYILYKDPDVIKIVNGNLENEKLLLYVGLFVATILAIGLITEWWIHYFYGKYAKEIRKVIDELKE